MTQEISFLHPLVNTATVDKREEEKWGIPKSTYASGLNECLRKQWYTRKGYAEINLGQKASWYRNASAGTALHIEYQDLFKRAGTVAKTEDVLAHAGFTLEDFAERVREKGLPEFAEEIPIPINDYDIGGKADGVHRITGEIELDDGTSLSFNNDFIVVEIKTVKEKYFKSLVKSAKWRGYYSQVQIYMHFFKIQWTILFAVNRNDDEIKEFLIPYDPQYCEERLARALRIKKFLADNVVPPAENTFDNCYFCGHKDICNVDGY